MSASSALSRRVSEFVGVLSVRRRAALAHRARDLQPRRPGVVLQHRGRAARHEPGREGRGVRRGTLAPALGYAAYLFPVLAAVVGWYRFWCTPIDALYTKIVGRRPAVRLDRVVPGPRACGRARRAARRSSPAGWLGDQLAGALAASFNRTGSLIIILTALFLSLILTTQFSFGRVFSAISGWLRERVSARVAAFWNWREERRRDRQRREIVAKHAKRAAALADTAKAAKPQAASSRNSTWTSGAPPGRRPAPPTRRRRRSTRPRPRLDPGG